MTLPAFNFREISKSDPEDLLDACTQMFRSLRDIMLALNDGVAGSGNGLRFSVCVPSQHATDERVVYVGSIRRKRQVLENAWLSVRSNLGSGTTFLLQRHNSDGTSDVASWVTAFNGALVANQPVQMRLEATQNLTLKEGEYFTLKITGNTPDEGLIQLDMLEVWP